MGIESNLAVLSQQMSDTLNFTNYCPEPNYQPTKPIRCKIKNVSTQDQQILKESEGLLLISVGQEAHEGERLEATIKLLNQTFKSCTISLYDSLQRHTMSFLTKQSPLALHKHAHKEGDLWLERNRNLLNKLTIPYKIKRWDEWIMHSDYNREAKVIKNLLESDIIFSNAFHDAAYTYLKRFASNNTTSPATSSIMQTRCLDYLVEECAVLALWAKLGYRFEIYPNKHNTAIEATRMHIIKEKYQLNLTALTLRFVNAKQLKPQKFMTIE